MLIRLIFVGRQVTLGPESLDLCLEIGMNKCFFPIQLISAIETINSIWDQDPTSIIIFRLSHGGRASKKKKKPTNNSAMIT